MKHAGQRPIDLLAMRETRHHAQRVIAGRVADGWTREDAETLTIGQRRGPKPLAPKERQARERARWRARYAARRDAREVQAPTVQHAAPVVYVQPPARVSLPVHRGEQVRCVPYACTLSRGACAARYVRTLVPPARGLARHGHALCVGCTDGAARAESLGAVATPVPSTVRLPGSRSLETYIPRHGVP